MEKQIFAENESRVHGMLLKVSWGGVIAGVLGLLGIRIAGMSDLLTYNQIIGAALAGIILFGLPTFFLRRKILSHELKYILVASSVLFVTILCYLLPQLNESFAFYYYAVVVTALYLDPALAIFSAVLCIAGNVFLVIAHPQLIPTVSTVGVFTARFIAFSLAVAGVYCFIRLARNLVRKIAVQQGRLLSVNEYLRNLVGQIADTSSNLAAAGEELLANAEETSAAIEEISNTTSEMAKGAELTGAHARQTAEIIASYAVVSQEVASSAQSSQEVAAEMRKAATRGTEAVRTIIDVMNKVANAITQAETTVQELAAYSGQIESSNKALDEIAKQINMFALNATIEASRTGSNGQGFSVIANEISKMSRNSHEMLGKITGSLFKIKEKIDATIAVFASSHEEASRGAELGSGLAGIFEDLLVKAKAASDTLGSINESIQSQFSSLANIQRSSEELANVAEKNAAGANMVAGVTEETAASVEYVTRSAMELTKISEALSQSIQTSKIYNDPEFEEIGDSKAKGRKAGKSA
ncbi:MAG: methyl-accepting chemotaxis protein [Bacillota bacterium]|jgi:methyl-accepting chemotaxis protein